MDTKTLAVAGAAGLGWWWLTQRQAGAAVTTPTGVPFDLGQSVLRDYQRRVAAGAASPATATLQAALTLLPKLAAPVVGVLAGVVVKALQGGEATSRAVVTSLATRGVEGTVDLAATPSLEAIARGYDLADLATRGVEGTVDLAATPSLEAIAQGYDFADLAAGGPGLPFPSLEAIARGYDLADLAAGPTSPLDVLQWLGEDGMVSSTGALTPHGQGALEAFLSHSAEMGIDTLDVGGLTLSRADAIAILNGTASPQTIQNAEAVYQAALAEIRPNVERAITSWPELQAEGWTIGQVDDIWMDELALSKVRDLGPLAEPQTLSERIQEWIVKETTEEFLAIHRAEIAQALEETQGLGITDKSLLRIVADTAETPMPSLAKPLVTEGVGYTVPEVVAEPGSTAAVVNTPEGARVSLTVEQVESFQRTAEAIEAGWIEVPGADAETLALARQAVESSNLWQVGEGADIALGPVTGPFEGLPAADVDLAVAAEFGATGAEAADLADLAAAAEFGEVGAGGVTIAGQSLGTILQGAAVVAALASIGFTIFGDKPDEQKAIDSSLDAASIGLVLTGFPVLAGVAQVIKFVVDRFGFSGREAEMLRAQAKEKALQQHLAAGSYDWVVRIGAHTTDVPTLVNILTSSDNASNQGFIGRFFGADRQAEFSRAYRTMLTNLLTGLEIPQGAVWTAEYDARWRHAFLTYVTAQENMSLAKLLADTPYAALGDLIIPAPPAIYLPEGLTEAAASGLVVRDSPVLDTSTLGLRTEQGVVWNPVLADMFTTVTDGQGSIGFQTPYGIIWGVPDLATLPNAVFDSAGMIGLLTEAGIIWTGIIDTEAAARYRNLLASYA